MSSESIVQGGFCCERKDREERGCGGVAFYVAEIMVNDRLHDIEYDKHKVPCIRLKP